MGARKKLDSRVSIDKLYDRLSKAAFISICIMIIASIIVANALGIAIIHTENVNRDFKRSIVNIEIDKVDGLYINQTSSEIELEFRLDFNDDNAKPINFNDVIRDSTGKSLSEYPNLCKSELAVNIKGTTWIYNASKMTFKPYSLWGLTNSSSKTNTGTEGITFESLANKLDERDNKNSPTYGIMSFMFGVMLVSLIVWYILRSECEAIERKRDCNNPGTDAK